MSKLTLELNSAIFKEELFNSNGMIIMMTPPIDKEYWHYRVKLHKEQAILGFPKFGTIGIGFATEDSDWNTNLPYRLDTQEIYDHIKINKKYKQIKKFDCLKAIKLIQQAIEEKQNENK